MADEPSTPAAGAVSTSPKLVLPPMTVSPGVTRLDRVLDLVTDHEAQFRDHELRVVDISTRVAAVERAVGVTEVRSGSFAGGSPYGTYPDGDRACDDVPLDLRSELADARASIAHLREETAEALREVRSEVRRLVGDADAQKAGLKSVLRDVLGRVASQIEAVRAHRARDDDGPGDAGGSNAAYASAADLAALAERVSRAETAAAASSPSRRPSSDDARRISETEQRVDALAEALRRLRRDGDDSPARVASIGAAGGVGFASSSAPSAANAAAGSRIARAPADGAVAERLRELTRRFDEQREETEALKRVFFARLGYTRAGGGDDDVDVSRGSRAETASDARARGAVETATAEFGEGDPTGTSRAGDVSEPAFSSPRVNPETRGSGRADDGLVRLGFGAYAGASLVATSTEARARREETVPNAVPRNAGFVAEAAARSLDGATSRRERADRAAATFRESIAGSPR